MHSLLLIFITTVFTLGLYQRVGWTNINLCSAIVLSVEDGYSDEIIWSCEIDPQRSWSRDYKTNTCSIPIHSKYVQHDNTGADIRSCLLILSFDCADMMNEFYHGFEDLRRYYNNYKQTHPPSGAIPAFSKCLYGVCIYSQQVGDPLAAFSHSSRVITLVMRWV